MSIRSAWVVLLQTSQMCRWSDESVARLPWKPRKRGNRFEMNFTFPFSSRRLIFHNMTETARFLPLQWLNRNKTYFELFLVNGAWHERREVFAELKLCLFSFNASVWAIEILGWVELSHHGHCQKSFSENIFSAGSETGIYIHFSFFFAPLLLPLSEKMNKCIAAWSLTQVFPYLRSSRKQRT